MKKNGLSVTLQIPLVSVFFASQTALLFLCLNNMDVNQHKIMDYFQIL